MNKDNAHLYLPLVQALIDGKLQRNDGTAIYPEWNDAQSLSEAVGIGNYRVKPLDFAPIPDGAERHNPDNLTPEQVGEGYRLLVTQEADGGYHRMENSGYWDPTDSTWTYRSSWHWDKSSTICVPLSTPYPDGSRVVDGKLVKSEPAKVQLGPEDVTPGSTIRYKLAVALELWWLVLSVSKEGMYVFNPREAQTLVKWSRAFAEMEIHRPGNLDANGKPVFEPCWKLQ
jgi:hypothetical protein